MKYGILYTDENGESHFKDGELAFEWVNFAPPAPPVGLTNYMQAKQKFFSNYLQIGLVTGIQLPRDSSFVVFRVSLNLRQAMAKHVFTGRATFSFSKILGVKVTKAELPVKRTL